jgi:cell division protein FtsI/penicillin-binding protein 2
VQPPSVALRVAAIGMLAVVVFAIILFRLWFLQILPTQRGEANDNRLHGEARPPRAPSSTATARSSSTTARQRHRHTAHGRAVG